MPGRSRGGLFWIYPEWLLGALVLLVMMRDGYALSLVFSSTDDSGRY